MKHGGDGPSKGFRGTLAERFERKTMPDPKSDCVLWIGAARATGYGRIMGDYKIEEATHVALKLAGIEVPKGAFVCHHCDNPRCVNVDHLFHASPVYTYNLQRLISHDGCS